MKRFLVISFVFAAFTANLLAQRATPSVSPTPKSPADDEIVKITTTLIQIDVTVTDKNGKIVSNLKPEDFDVFENGEKQEISNFSFINSTPQAKTLPAKTPEKNQIGVPIPPISIRPEQVRRTIALVVDDLALSYESIRGVQKALKKFVDEQMQPNDLVAIIRTGSGIGALQQFTADKNLLYAAIDKVRWNPAGSGGLTAYKAIEPTLQQQVQASGAIQRASASVMDDQIQAEKDRMTAFNQFREDIFSFGTLGSLSFVVKGMKELPGRKSVMLFSDGFSVCTSTDIRKDGGRCNQMEEAIKKFTDLCNRNSVTVYTQDARGLNSSALTVQDIPATAAKSLEDAIGSRTDEILNKQQGLGILAVDTGGKAVFNTNNLSLGLEKLLEDTRGFYLIGYQPSSDTFDPKTRKFNKLEVKVKQEGLKVSYRSGFFGVTDKDLPPVQAAKDETPLQQILKPLTSPFSANDINLKLNALFGLDEKGGSFIHSFLFIDAKDLVFVDGPAGSKQTTFDVLAISFGDNGIIVDQVGKNYTFTGTAEEYRNILEEGFAYNFVFPIKKPGAYQLRVAVRDAASSKVGSASQFIEVPDLKKASLSVSGIGLENFTPDEWRDLNSKPTQKQNNLVKNTSMRRIKRGTILSYTSEIYNAKFDQNKAPQVFTQVRLFRDGKLVLDGKQNPLPPDSIREKGKISFAGALGIGTEMKPGDYVLQIIAIDNLAKAKDRVATQWVQFELTN